MTSYAVGGPNWTLVDPGSTGVVIGDVQMSYDTMRRLSDAERAAYGIAAVTDDPVPAGKIVTGSSLVDRSGKPARVWALVDVPLPTMAELKAYAADARYRREVGGITIGGLPIATDDRSKLLIAGARIAAEADPTFTTPWVAANGAIATVDAPTIVALSDAVLAHVAAGFGLYATVWSAIDAGTTTTTAAVDTAFGL